MDLYDWYYKQVVSPGELSAAFEAADSGLRSMVRTLGINGLSVGGDVVPTTPTAGLSAVVKGPLIAYDDLGERIHIDVANSAVNLAQDENGASTTIFTPSQERYLGIFVKFERNLSDPRTDGDGNEVMFARLETAKLLVAAGAPAPVGAASRPALRSEHVLLADVRLVTGQTKVQVGDILTDRTQYLFRASNGSLNLWGRTFPEIVQRLVDRFAQFMHDADQQFLAFSGNATDAYNAFVTQVNNLLANLHAKTINFAPNENGSGIAATKVQAAIEEVKASIPGATTGLPATAVSFDQTWLTNTGANVQAAMENLPAWLRRTANTFTARQTFKAPNLFDPFGLEADNALVTNVLRVPNVQVSGGLITYTDALGNEARRTRYIELLGRCDRPTGPAEMYDAGIPPTWVYMDGRWEIDPWATGSPGPGSITFPCNGLPDCFLESIVVQWSYTGSNSTPRLSAELWQQVLYGSGVGNNVGATTMINSASMTAEFHSSNGVNKGTLFVPVNQWYSKSSPAAPGATLTDSQRHFVKIFAEGFTGKVHSVRAKIQVQGPD